MRKMENISIAIIIRGLFTLMVRFFVRSVDDYIVIVIDTVESFVDSTIDAYRTAETRNSV